MEAIMVKPIPDGFHNVTPYIMVSGAQQVLDFLKRGFDAEEISVLRHPSGTVAHAQLKIGDSMLMLSDPMDKSPSTPATLYIYTPDVDELYNRALQAGGTSVMEPADQFYGDRTGGVKDPAGNTWFIGTHIEDVSDDEINRRAMAEFKRVAA
jgi:PhnB protein